MSSSARPHLLVTGAAGHGKDTIGDHVVAQYGYARVSFSDGIREEIGQAYREAPEPVTQAWQSGRDIKNIPQSRLALVHCGDDRFVRLALEAFGAEDSALPMPPGSEQERLLLPRSPRRIQQIWGSDYRRAQDEDYWLNYTRSTVNWAVPQVFTSVRYANELEVVRDMGGVRIHVDRPGHREADAHVSEQGIPIDDETIVVCNDADVASLHRIIDGIVLRFAARQVCDIAKASRPGL